MTSALGWVLAVNPVPWARSQMAFTLAFHIVLVPLGVAWGFMTLVANYRAIAQFATAYADQNERDYAAFAAAVTSGRVVAQRET